jgi:RHS repeat-associated protein
LLVYGTSGYQFDPQGNATHLMDDDGLVLAHLAYDAWGQRMSGNNPTPYGYKGQWGYYTDGETGVLLLTHRYLDPAMGRLSSSGYLLKASSEPHIVPSVATRFLRKETSYPY